MDGAQSDLYCINFLLLKRTYIIWFVSLSFVIQILPHLFMHRCTFNNAGNSFNRCLQPLLVQLIQNGQTELTKNSIKCLSVVVQDSKVDSKVVFERLHSVSSFIKNGFYYTHNYVISTA